MGNDTRVIACGFVLTDGGSILVQLADPTSRWGFRLSDDDQTWDGGFGSWELLKIDDPEITAAEHERLDWLFDQHAEALGDALAEDEKRWRIYGECDFDDDDTAEIEAVIERCCDISERLAELSKGRPEWDDEDDEDDRDDED